jgi:DNA-binding transcriptional regulator YiaG
MQSVPRPGDHGRAAADGASCGAVLRALREARALTQDGWAAHLAVSRATVQRWERGEGVPDADVERAILEYCRERGLFRTFDRGPLAGVTLTEEWMRDLLAQSRLEVGAANVNPLRPARVATRRLVRRAGDDAGIAQLLGRGITTIGRDEDNTIVINNTNVSRHHADVRWDRNGYVLHDLGSKNGTYVNGERITSHLLRDGDVIALAGLPSLTLVFVPGEETVTVERDESLDDEDPKGTPPA